MWSLFSGPIFKAYHDGLPSSLLLLTNHMVCGSYTHDKERELWKVLRRAAPHLFFFFPLIQNWRFEVWLTIIMCALVFFQLIRNNFIVYEHFLNVIKLFLENQEIILSAGFSLGVKKKIFNLGESYETEKQMRTLISVNLKCFKAFYWGRNWIGTLSPR